MSSPVIDIVICHYSLETDYPALLLAACLRSILDNVPEEDYRHIWVVDDCSAGPDLSDRLLQDLESGRYPKVRVHRNGEAGWPGQDQDVFLPTSWGVDYNRRISLGHGRSLAEFIDLHMKKENPPDYLFFLDADSIVLKGNLFKDAITEQHRLQGALGREVCAVGEVFGPKIGVPTGTNWCFAKDGGHFIENGAPVKSVPPTTSAGAPDGRFGCVHVSCMLAPAGILRTSAPGRLHNYKWIHVAFFEEALRLGYQSIFFPFYSGEYVFHLTAGTVYNLTNEALPTAESWYTKRGGAVRGVPRDPSQYYVGYLLADGSHKEYFAALAAQVPDPTKIGDLEIYVDRSWFITPDEDHQIKEYGPAFGGRLEALASQTVQPPRPSAPMP
jgi:hypothetical protein